MAAAPLVDGPRVVAATGSPDGALMAFDKLTGKVLWKAVSLRGSGPGYSSPFLLEAGGAQATGLLASRGVASVDPVTGELLWEQAWKQTDSLVVATPVHLKNWLLMSSFYKGSLMMEPDPAEPTAKLAWKGSSESEIDTDGLHSITSTPVIEMATIYGVCSYGQLRCLQASTGKRVWETQAVTKEKARWASAFLVRHGDRYFINNDRGDLIIARLSPEGYEEVARTLIKFTATAGIGRREMKAVNWIHPEYANRTFYARNDEELNCCFIVSLSK